MFSGYLKSRLRYFRALLMCRAGLALIAGQLIAVYASPALADYYTATCSCDYESGARSCHGSWPLSAYDKQALYNQCDAKTGGVGGIGPIAQHRGELGPNGPLPTEISKGPDLQWCVPGLSTVVAEGSVGMLFGELTGNVKTCIVTPPGVRFSKVVCYMGAGKIAPPEGQRISAPKCHKFDDTSSCDIGYGSPHGPLTNYIGAGGEQVVCAFASAEKDTGDRYWGLVGGE